MAVRNTIISIPANTWTSVTDNSVSGLFLQNISDVTVRVRCTVDTTAPTGTGAPIILRPYQIITTDDRLSTLAPGTLTGAGYVWVLAESAASVSVSHAAS